jgi:hypothetical protein
MRGLLVVVVAIAAAGCGGEEKTANDKARAAMAKVETTCAPGVNCAGDRLRPFRKCTHTAGGYRACTTFRVAQEVSGIYRQFGERWIKLPVAAPSAHGWWRRVVPSPDGELLLVQWSGECEVQSSYLVWSRGGEPRAIFAGAGSEILGWADDGPARVRLLGPIRWSDGRIRPAGIYRVDPVLLGVYLERSRPARRGC